MPKGQSYARVPGRKVVGKSLPLRIDHCLLFRIIKTQNAPACDCGSVRHWLVFSQKCKKDCFWHFSFIWTFAHHLCERIVKYPFSQLDRYRYPISVLTNYFVCQNRAFRCTSLLPGKVCDLNGIRCSAVGHSRALYHFHNIKKHRLTFITIRRCFSL